MKFFEGEKIHINNLQKKTLVYLWILFGILLSDLCNRTRTRRIPQSFKVIVKEKFGISDYYASRLRWLGRLWGDYKNISQPAISFNQFYVHRQQVDNLFQNYPSLTNEWKIIDI